MKLLLGVVLIATIVWRSSADEEVSAQAFTPNEFKALYELMVQYKYGRADNCPTVIKYETQPVEEGNDLVIRHLDMQIGENVLQNCSDAGSQRVTSSENMRGNKLSDFLESIDGNLDKQTVFDGLSRELRGKRWYVSISDSARTCGTDDTRWFQRGETFFYFDESKTIRLTVVAKVTGGEPKFLSLPLVGNIRYMIAVTSGTSCIYRVQTDVANVILGTARPSDSPSSTPRPSKTPTPAPSASQIPVASSTPSPSTSVSPSMSVSQTISPSATPSVSSTTSSSPTSSISRTVSPTPTRAPTTSPSKSPSTSPAMSTTPSAIPSTSSTPSATPTRSRTPSASPTISTTPSATATKSSSASATMSTTPSATSTRSMTPSASATRSMTPSTTPTRTSSPRASTSASATPSGTARATVTASPTKSLTPQKSATKTPTPSSTPSTTPAIAIITPLTSPSTTPTASKGAFNVLFVSATPSTTPSPGSIPLGSATPSNSATPVPVINIEPGNLGSDDRNSSSVDGTSTCFPGGSMVRLLNGVIIRMDEVRIGDYVWTGEKFSKVLMFTHRRSDVFGKFVKLSTMNGSISVTPGHYLYVNEGLLPAREVKVGDRLSGGMVVAKELVQEWGLYNPQTENGDIVVDGMKASCYTETIPGVGGHALMSLVRMVHHVGRMRELMELLGKSVEWFADVVMNRGKI